MKSRHWLELLMPTLLLGVGWLAVSAATTVYIAWLDGEHERVLSDNVVSIGAAAEMQSALWEFLAVEGSSSHPDDIAKRKDTLHRASERFQTSLRRADASAIIPVEQRIIREIRAEFEALASQGESATTAETATRTQQLLRQATSIARHCEDLAEFNRHLMNERRAEYRIWSQRYQAARLLFVIVAPILGVCLGFRMSQRLGRRIADIQFSLAGVSKELGTVKLSTPAYSDNLTEIEARIREVAGRIHEVITELNAAQCEAQRNERLAAIGQLAAGVAHGLRNPLTAVKLLVQTMMSQNHSAENAVEHLDVIQDEILRMEHTIQSLLDFARPPPPQRCRIALGEAVRRAMNLVQGRAAQSGIDVVLSDFGSDLWVMGDPEQLHQVFVNLLLNGMDAMPHGGRLQIELVPPPLAPQIGFGPGDQHFCAVNIIDEGAGIVPELLDRIFDPFVSTKARGSGLGLAISRRFVEEHGGKLSASNRPEGGAVFTMILPVLPDPVSHEAEFDGGNSAVGLQLLSLKDG